MVISRNRQELAILNDGHWEEKDNDSNRVCDRTGKMKPFLAAAASLKRLEDSGEVFTLNHCHFR